MILHMTKKNTVNTTSVMSRSYKNAIQTVLKVKGGFNKQVKGDLISSDSKNSNIYKMNKEYNL